MNEIDSLVAAVAQARAGGTDDATIWELAKRATEMCSAAAPVELVEAVAALQKLACSGAASTELREERRAWFEQQLHALPQTIRLSPNGPLLVTNAERLTNWLGDRQPTLPVMALCRCGASSTKPFCDGSHATSGFSDSKDPNRVPDRRDSYVGEQVTIFDNRGLCQHSGFCSDRLANVFRVKQEPFVAPSGGRMDEILRAVRDCPSGALGYAIDGVEARESTDWHGKRTPSIEVSKDGPYRIVGSMPLVEADGSAVARNEGASLEHYALCRCGRSQNKPFCSGMHWYVAFKDPILGADGTPTIFEWAGGLPALTRMTRTFYEKYVPADELLAPLFANMAADHPERVAKWLAEVFCGPKNYSQEYGGYTRMLSQHIGKCLTEAMRQRWVTLLLQSARDAGLPNDPEFASVFEAYIEWGSRLAVENSQTQSQPPAHMPMPHWDWSTSAGPPGSRLSALAPKPQDDPEPALPAEGTPLHFNAHIKSLFRERDRQSMSFKLDLWEYADVREHAQSILTRVSDGTMPCDKAWPKERVAVFARWVNSGMLE
ncbi:MAG TPA: CDGSH iron-sulfur domain-containing protein [Candidatus Cybelea sp.]|jgi:CDGSH-type Zn-finger protein/truncated hemoglobin YjbI